MDIGITLPTSGRVSAAQRTDFAQRAEANGLACLGVTDRLVYGTYDPLIALAAAAAVTRDIRQYIGKRGYRKIPVGYSAADVSENRKEMADYMNCGSDEERSDFFAFNDYSWCDPSDFKKSGWDQKVRYRIT